MTTKTQKYFQKVQEYKDRFQNMTVEKLRQKERTGYLIKEAAVAIRKLIEEKQKSKNHANKS